MKNSIIPLLDALIRIPSVSSDIPKLYEIVDFVEAEFSHYKNAYIQRYVFNEKPSIAIQNFEGLKADIILNGHLDVVPSSEENQFEPIHKDGKIYGRGAGDMKVGDAIMITIMKDIFENRFTDKKISLILTCDEEIGGEDGAKELIELGYTAKEGVIIPDGGSMREAVTIQKGIFDIEVEVTGKSGHASRPWLCDNAIDKTMLLYKALREYIQDDEKLHSGNHWSSSVNLTQIQSGTGTNVIPEICKAYFDIRITEKFRDVDELQQNLEEICSKYDAEIVFYFHGDLVYTDPENIFIQNYLTSCKKITGEFPEILKEHGASDGRFFASKGIPLILHKPTCENIHGKQENVEIESIEKIYDIYRNYIFSE